MISHSGCNFRTTSTTTSKPVLARTGYKNSYVNMQLQQYDYSDEIINHSPFDCVFNLNRANEVIYFNGYLSTPRLVL